MTKLIWHTEKRKVKDLIPYKDNPRYMPDLRDKQLLKSMKIYNLVEIPAIDLDGTLIAGNQRVRIMMKLGRENEEIDVRVPNRKLTKEEFEKYNLISNKLTGEWNYEILKNFEIGTLLESGFDDSDLSHIFDELLSVEDDEFNLNEEIPKIKNPKTKLGDLIFLGEHRLVCGDSTDPEVVEKLVGDYKINILDFDPNYNIGLDYNLGIGGKGTYGGKVNDKRSDSEYRDFLKKLLQNGMAHTYPDFHCFCWGDEGGIGILQSLYSELGINNKRVCLWIKNNFNPTANVAFNKIYEPCVYGTVGSPYLSPLVHNLSEILNKEIENGNRLSDSILDLINIWLVRRLSTQSYEHPTQKPVSLYEKPLRRCSKPGDNILDLCAGSGALMSACEQLKRRAFLCELNPVFCDVIIERYRQLTGKESKYANS